MKLVRGARRKENESNGKDMSRLLVPPRRARVFVLFGSVRIRGLRLPAAGSDIENLAFASNNFSWRQCNKRSGQKGEYISRKYSYFQDIQAKCYTVQSKDIQIDRARRRQAAKKKHQVQTIERHRNGHRIIPSITP